MNMITLTSNQDVESVVGVPENQPKSLSNTKVYDSKIHNWDCYEGLLKDCAFYDTEFYSCNFSLVDLSGSKFSNCFFNDCKFEGVNWHKLKWSISIINCELEFVDCNLNYSNFLGLHLNEAIFENCSLREIDFRDANLERTSFVKSDLTGSLFNKTNLSHCNFSHASGYDIDILNNQVTKSIFSMPEAINLLNTFDIHIDT
ncbi:pentapeptide repeat-containing protein [Marinomonas agarivorans]|nr:pentapeptide repeat-containing protein [Marinomonas agarivorans]